MADAAANVAAMLPSSSLRGRSRRRSRQCAQCKCTKTTLWRQRLAVDGLFCDACFTAPQERTHAAAQAFRHEIAAEVDKDHEGAYDGTWECCHVVPRHAPSRQATLRHAKPRQPRSAPTS